jgi:Ca2+-binding RTX toxin-like protein
MDVTFDAQAATRFSAALSYDPETTQAFEAKLNFDITGSGMSFDAQGVPLDGLFTQITLTQSYILNEGDAEVFIPLAYFTGVETDISDVFEQFSTPEQGMNLLALSLMWAGTKRLDGEVGVVISAQAEGGLTKGSAKNDVIIVDQDQNWFKAGWGDDVMEATGGPVRFNGQAGNDQLVGGGFDDILRGGSGDDSVQGLDGNDKMYGQGGNDGLRGDAGDDLLWGGAGRDYLIGGAGRDKMVGGAGADMFVFNVATAMTDGYSHKAEYGRNVVRDFDFGEDALRFGYGYNQSFTQAEAFDWFMQHADDHNGQVRLIDGNVRIIIKDASVDDFTLEHFAGSDTHNSYNDWLVV